jgi:hypothetical protein
MDILKAILTALIPPGINASPIRMLYWRWTVAIVTGACFMHLIYTVTRALGMTMFLGWAPYMTRDAEAADLQTAMQQVNQSLKVLQQGQRDQVVRDSQRDLLETRIQQCSVQHLDGQSSFLFEQRLNNAQRDYRNATGYYLPIPDCKDVVRK